MASSALAPHFPALPADVSRMILEASGEKALEESFNDLLKLVLVSRQVHEWIAPILYRSIQLDSPKRIAKFRSQTIRAPASSFKDRCLRSIKHLILEPGKDEIDREIISACTSLQTLAYWANWPWTNTEQLASAQPPSTLIRLSTFAPTFETLVAPKLTHLELLNGFTDWPKDWSGFAASFPCLTHLSLDMARQEGKDLSIGLATISPHLPESIQVIILFLFSEIAANKKTLLDGILGNLDKRLVVGIQYPCPDFLSTFRRLVICDQLEESIERWKMDEDSLELDHWIMADDIIKKRTRIDASDYSIPCDHDDEEDDDEL